MRDLPPDILLFHIVPKLPANSVVRFTCVSKRWYRFLRTPGFKKLHQQHIANDDHQSHQKLLVFSYGRPFRFSTIDCEAPEKGLTTLRSFPFEADYNRVRMLTSCHGLVCVGIKKKNWYETDFKFIMFCNPLTGEYKKLSSNKHCKLFQGKAYGLYYSSSDDDYRLLHVTDGYDSTVNYIYSLKTDSWRMVDATNNFENIPRFIYEQWTLSSFLNGNLYFLKQGESLSRSTGSVIMFDTKKEKFTEIEAPPSFEDRDIKCFSLTVQKGQIYLCVMYDIGVIGYSIKTYFEVWVMNDDRDWRKVASYRHPPDDIGGFHPLHLMKNRNWLMIHTGYHSGIYKVDMEKNTKKGKGKDKDMDKSFLFDLTDILSIFQKEKYIETFVSPNRYEN